MNGDRNKVLLTGASGYVGGRLLPRLVQRGIPVRCLSRNPKYLASRTGASGEIVEGDVLDPESLERAFTGIHTAFYLVHSMSNEGSKGFEERDREAARNFANAARTAGVSKIVYLGGLGDEGETLSTHLRSRHEVGRILRESGVATIEFRASIVIGSGSLSFEMLRSLVERLPVMVTPRWVRVNAQPISIEDLLGYLEASLLREATGNPIYEIGGSEQVSYGELMREYARQRGLRRFMVPVPILTPRLSGLWLGLVTPLYARIGRALVESICHETVVRDERARHDFDIRPIGVREAISHALENEDREIAQTRWSDAISSGERPGDAEPVERHGRRLVDRREIEVDVPPTAAFAPIRRIGGETGWYAYDWLWRLRGFIDLLVGGVGVRRGRRDPETLHPGDPLDWWRVESFAPHRELLLRAEMRLPGRAWLKFEVIPTGRGSAIRQTALFDPAGLAGQLYWYGIYPLHAAIFRRMLASIARRARGEAKRRGSHGKTRREEPTSSAAVSDAGPAETMRAADPCGS